LQIKLVDWQVFIEIDDDRKTIAQAARLFINRTVCAFSPKLMIELGSPPTAWDVRREKTTDNVINGHAKHAMATIMGRRAGYASAVRVGNHRNRKSFRPRVEYP
jgi:hypothetical protein